MTPLAIVSMIFFLACTWGGFVLLLLYAMRCESRRDPGDPPGAPGRP